MTGLATPDPERRESPAEGGSDNGHWPAVRRGRPRKVTVDEIVDAAIEIGLDKVTIRKVADSLGMTVPGIAYHVRTRDDLLALVMTRAITTLYPPGDDWSSTFQETVTRFADGLYVWLRDHPILVMQIAQGRVLEENIEIHLERLLGAVDAEALDRSWALDVVSQVTAAVIGAAILESAQTRSGRPARPRDCYAAVRTVLTALLQTPPPASETRAFPVAIRGKSRF